MLHSLPKLQRVAQAALFTLLCTACAGTQTAPKSVTEKRWVPAYVFGIFGAKALDIRDVCASGVAQQVSIRTTPATLALGIVTFGIYTPQEVKIQCRDR